MTHLSITRISFFITWCLTASFLAADTLVPHPSGTGYLAADDAPFAGVTVTYSSHTPFDIGTLDAFLDGNRATVARTPSINPAEIVFTIEEPVTLQNARVVLIGVPHTLYFAAAMNTNDLMTRTGSYRVLADGPTDARGIYPVLLSQPVTAKAFHLKATREAGDDFVHFYALQSLAPVEVTNICVTYKIRPEHGPEQAIYEELTHESTRQEDALLDIRVRAVTADGTMYNVTEHADIRVHGPDCAVPWMDTDKYHLFAPGEVKVSVRAAGHTRHGVITVTPRERTHTKKDIEVLYVERLPRIDFDGPNGGWPTNGQPVIWRAHVQNWGTTPVTTYGRWELDGEEVHHEKITLPPGDVITVSLPWSWTQERHEITFSADHVPGEFITGNNSVSFYTDALTVGFYVERSYADFFHVHQHELGLNDANSYAGWAQRQIRHYNRMLEAAEFPFTPNGCYDRLRLDLVKIVPDGALPMRGGLPSNNPNNDDKTVDLIWGFPWKVDQLGEGIDIDRVRQNMEQDRWQWFFMDLALFHELGHARYLIDGYGFDVHSGPPDNRKILITDDEGDSILGKYLITEGIVSWNKYPGLMGGDYHLLSEYDALMMNRVAGQRARGGNYNGPTVIGEFLQDIPESYDIRFVSTEGEPLSNAEIAVYWAGPDHGSWYGKFYDDEVNRRYTADDDGRVTADRYLFADDGRIIHTFGHANSKPILRVDYNGETYFTFLEVSTLNMYANAPEGVADMTIELTLPLREPGATPTPLPNDWERATLPDWREVAPFVPVEAKKP